MAKFEKRGIRKIIGSSGKKLRFYKFKIGVMNIQLKEYMTMKMTDELKISIVTAICLLTLALIKNVSGARLDFISLFGPFWVFIIYIIIKDKVKKSKIYSSPLFWSSLTIFVTLAIIILL